MSSSHAGSSASNSSSTPIPEAWANFHGVTVQSMVWLDSTATVRNQQHFDDVGQRKYYVDMFRLQAPSVSLSSQIAASPCVAQYLLVMNPAPLRFVRGNSGLWRIYTDERSIDL